MAQSKALRPEWLPAVALSAALAAAMLAWNPQVGDLAAQVFRTELFQHAGLAIWNGSWYGGHYTAHLQRPLPAAGLAARAAARRRARRWSPPPTSSIASSASAGEQPARWATLWFAAGVVTLLADGQLTFALGVAFGLASLRSLQIGRIEARPSRPRRPAPSPARSPPPSWPACVLAGALERGRRANRVGDRGSPALALALIVVPNLAFPEPGQFPFAFSSFVAIPLWCGSCALRDPRACARRSGSCAGSLAGYLLASALLWLVPEPDRRQRGAPRRPLRRAGARRGGAGPAAAGLALVPGAGHGRRPLLAGDGERQPDRPQRRRPLDLAQPTSSPRRSGCATHGGAGDRGSRFRRPPNHWESAYLAPAVRAGPGLAAPARHHPRRHLLRRESALTDRGLRRVAAPERDLLRRPSRRAARLLLGRRAAADPQQPALISICAGPRPTGASTRFANPKPLVEPLGAAAAHARSGSAVRASASTSPAPANSLSASTSPRTGRSPAAPAACCAAASGPWPAPRTRASCASRPTSPSAGPGTRSPARARPAETGVGA